MTSLYGLSIDLPTDWVDVTEYLFAAKGSDIQKLVFSREPLLPSQVDPWLAHVREQVTQLDGIRVTAISDYEHPAFRIRGFDAVVSANGERGGMSFIAVSFPTYAIIVQPKWRGTAEPLVQGIVSSLALRGKPDDALALLPSGSFRYAVYDLTFDCSVRFELPRAFAFRRPDGRGRMWCTRGANGARFQPPVWSARFELDPEASIITALDETRSVTASPIVPPELTGTTFDEAHWQGTCAGPDQQRLDELTWAEAWTDANAGAFRIWFAYQGARADALAVWNGVLLGARRD